MRSKGREVVVAGEVVVAMPTGLPPLSMGHRLTPQLRPINSSTFKVITWSSQLLLHTFKDSGRLLLQQIHRSV